MEMSIDSRRLVRELSLIVFLYTIDLGSEFACYSELQITRNRYDRLLSATGYITNGTKGYEFCTNSEWNYWDYSDKVTLFGRVVDVYLAFLVLSGAVFISYVVAYTWFIVRTLHRSTYAVENRGRIIQVKFAFGFLLSFILDIPGSSMAVSLHAMRYGAHGLHCWDCQQDATCDDKRELRHRVYISQVTIILLFLGLILVSLWKGVTTFYRWSKTDKVDCWQLRGCVALFVGTYYVAIMITPALAVFKYKFFLLPSQKENAFASFTDSLFMIGLLGWLIFMVIGCCFPLLRCIRVSSSGSLKDERKAYQHV